MGAKPTRHTSSQDNVERRRAHARTTPQREQLSPQTSTRRHSLAGHQHTCKARFTRARAPHPTQNDPPSHARQERASEPRPSMHSKGGGQPCRKGGDRQQPQHEQKHESIGKTGPIMLPRPPPSPLDSVDAIARDSPPSGCPACAPGSSSLWTGGGSQLKVGQEGDRCGARSNAVRMPRIAGCESGHSGLEGRAGGRSCMKSGGTTSRRCFLYLSVSF